MMFFMRCFRAGYRINSRDDKKNDAKFWYIQRDAEILRKEL